MKTIVSLRTGSLLRSPSPKSNMLLSPSVQVVCCPVRSASCYC